MKVEILEKTGVRHAGVLHDHGDRLTVSDEVGAQWCAAGWVKDLAGDVETGERRTDGPVMLSVDDGVIDQDAETLG